MASLSRIHVPLREPADVIPHLGKGERHWKEGRSARLLAEQWFAADAIPPAVTEVLDGGEEWRGSQLVDGFLERVTALPWGNGAGTQTDLLAIVRLAGGQLAVLGIEAKVNETFGPPAGVWLSTGGRNREDRLRGLCAFLGLPFAEAGAYRYQLFHRLAGTVLEARRYGAAHAALLVQSWCPRRSGWADFAGFAQWAGFGLLEPGTMSAGRQIGGVDLRIGWVME